MNAREKEDDKYEGIIAFTLKTSEQQFKGKQNTCSSEKVFIYLLPETSQMGFSMETAQLFPFSSAPSICHFSFLMSDNSSGAAVFLCYYLILLVDILVYGSLLHKELKPVSGLLPHGCF